VSPETAPSGQTPDPERADDASRGEARKDEVRSDGARVDEARPRIRPAVVFAVAQWAVMLVPAYLDPGGFAHFMGMFWGPVIGFVTLGAWWLWASRVPRRDRRIGAATFLVAAAITFFAVHPSMRAATVLWVLPTVTTSLVLVMLVARRVPWPRQRSWLVATAIAVIAFWMTLRLDGLDGGMAAEFAWRWTPTAEQEYLRQATQNDSDVDNPPAASLGAGSISLTAGDWPGFRGPRRDGRLEGVSFSTDWTKNPPRELWRRLVGPGWSSFAVVGSLLFTQEQRGEHEVVACYAADSGEELWVNRVEARFEEAVGGAGPRATPTFHEGWLYTFGASGILQRLEPATGHAVWTLDLSEETGASTPQWGFASSPLVIGDLVMVFVGAPNEKAVVACSRATGGIAWSAGNGKHSYSSIHPAKIGGIDQVIASSDYGMESFETHSGAPLWSHEWDLRGMARIVQPLVIDNRRVLIGTGYGSGTRSILVTPGQYAYSFNVRAKWETRRLKPYFNDFVYHDGFVYGFDRDIFTCLDAETGETRWKGGRYGYGQVLLVADMSLLLVLGEKGDVVLIDATPEGHREVAKFQALDGKTWNHPVIAHDKLFVRNGIEAACFELSPPPAAQ